MKIVTAAPATPAQPVWPVGTIALVRLKGSKKNQDGFLRYHALVGIPAGANVNADDPSTLVNVRHVALNLATGSVKGADYGIDQYDVLKVFTTMSVAD